MTTSQSPTAVELFNLNDIILNAGQKVANAIRKLGWHDKRSLGIIHMGYEFLELSEELTRKAPKAPEWMKPK